MSYTYKVKGARWLRKYTSSAQEPVYAAQVSAQRVADTLCDVPWTRANTDEGCIFTAHSGDELDENVKYRDSFDAALWCADHKNGVHRAFANACCYKIMLPDSAVGVMLESIAMKATCDPYCTYGLRIAVHASDDGVIPMGCAECRTGDAHSEGVAPRQASTSAAGDTLWYVNSADHTISPDGGLTLKKYLLVVVALENYATSRGNWLEGSGGVMNRFTLVTSAPIVADGWTDGGSVVDCTADEATELKVVSGGVRPPLFGANTGVFYAVRTLAGGLLDETANAVQSAGTDAAAGLHAVYSDWLDFIARMNSDAKDFATKMLPRSAIPAGPRPGAGFSLRKTVEELRREEYGEVEPVPVWKLAVSVMCVPFIAPAGGASRVRLSWPLMQGANGRLQVWLIDGTYVTEYPAAPTALGASTVMYDFTEHYTDVMRQAMTAVFLGEADAATDTSLTLDFAKVQTKGTFVLAVNADIASLNPAAADGSWQGVGNLEVSANGSSASGFETLWTPDISIC